MISTVCLFVSVDKSSYFICHQQNYVQCSKLATECCEYVKRHNISIYGPRPTHGLGTKPGINDVIR